MLTQEKNIQEQDSLNPNMGRMKFLKYTGVAVAGGILLLPGCKKDDAAGGEGVNLGSGDAGILNYAYALEQLEAAFYTQVVTGTGISKLSVSEAAIFSDIQKHEVGHRDFFKAALGSNAIQDLEVDFSSINFNDRMSILNAAKTFEDLGVSAYNGAGKLISDPAYLLIAGKIVSVEARHAAAIRDLISPKSASFSGDDVVSIDKGFDGAKMPSEVLSAASTYVKTRLNASNLPTS